MKLLTAKNTTVRSQRKPLILAIGGALCLVTLLGCKPSPSETALADSQTQKQSKAQHDTGMAHDGTSHSDMSNESGTDHTGTVHNDLNPTEPTEALGQDYSIYQVGGDWVDQNGDSMTLDALQGKNQVVAMAYTSCQHTCPILVRSMKQMHDEMTPEARAQTEFLIATLDTERDTPEVMANYAHHNQLGDNWRLMRSDEAGTRMLANTLNIKYQFADNGDINHSNLISVLDKEGRLVAQGVGVADSGIKPLIEWLNIHSK